MAASAVCRVAGAGTRVLLRTRRSVRWQQEAGLWGAGLRDVDREWAVNRRRVEIGAVAGSGPWEGHGPERGWQSRGWPGGGDGDTPAGL